MTMRRRILFVAALVPPGLSAMRGARAQLRIRIRPDSSPRLPQQPGQGLPIEDRRFIRDAMALSAAQLRASSQVASAGGEQETSHLAASLAERHRRLLDELHSLATARGLQPDASMPEAEAPSGPQVATAIRRLQAASDARAFLSAEVEIHPVLVELYQTEASNSLDHQLSQFAIVSLVGIQEDFAAVVRLAERRGLPGQRSAPRHRVHRAAATGAIMPLSESPP